MKVHHDKLGKTTLDLLKGVETIRGTEYKPAGGAVYLDDSFRQDLTEVARLVEESVGLEGLSRSRTLRHAFLSVRLEAASKLN